MTDFVRMCAGGMSLGLTVISGRQGGHSIVYAPSVLVSGYGHTEAEALESFEVGLEAFCSSVMGAGPGEAERELERLGFSRRENGFVSTGMDIGDFPPTSARVSFMEIAA